MCRADLAFFKKRADRYGDAVPAVKAFDEVFGLAEVVCALCGEGIVMTYMCWSRYPVPFPTVPLLFLVCC